VFSVPSVLKSFSSVSLAKKIFTTQCTEDTEKACPFVNRSYLQQLDALHNHWSFSEVPRLLFLNERPKHIPPHTRAEELCPNPVYLSRALTVCIKNAHLVDSEIRCLIRSRGIQSFLSKTPG